MKRWILGWLLWCTLSTSVHAEEAVPLPTTEEREKAVADLLHFDETGKIDDPPIRKAISFQLDTFAAFTLNDPDVKVGFGFVTWASPAWRSTLQFANGGLGFGIARVIIPVIDVSIGAGIFYDVRDDRVTPTVFTSVYKW